MFFYSLNISNFIKNTLIQQYIFNTSTLLKTMYTLYTEYF